MLEILFVIAIFAVVILSVGTFSISSFRHSTNSNSRLNAMLKLKEVSEAVIANKNDVWQSIIDNSNGGQKHIDLIDNKYEVGLKNLLFAVNLFKNHIRDFKEDNLSIQFSSDDNPIRINYEGSNIRIYFSLDGFIEYEDDDSKTN